MTLKTRLPTVNLQPVTTPGIAPKEGRLPVRTKLGFGIADLDGNLFFMAMGFWSLAFLTDVVGLGASAAGTVLPVVGLFATKSAGFSAVSAILGIIMTVPTLITFFSVKEGDNSKTPIPKEGFFETFLGVFKNKPYVIILLAAMILVERYPIDAKTCADMMEGRDRDTGHA